MRRRELIAGLGGAAAAWSLAARAQQQPKVARIGWMSRGNPTDNDPNMNAFRQGMRELGYADGRSFVMEPRFADGKTELMPEQALDVESQQVVLWQAESADWDLIIDAGVWPVPVVAVQPERKFGSSLS